MLLLSPGAVNDGNPETDSLPSGGESPAHCEPEAGPKEAQGDVHPLAPGEQQARAATGATLLKTRPDAATPQPGGDEGDGALQPVEVQQVSGWLRLFVGPGQVTELRAIR